MNLWSHPEDTNLEQYYNIIQTEQESKEDILQGNYSITNNKIFKFNNIPFIHNPHKFKYTLNAIQFHLNLYHIKYLIQDKYQQEIINYKYIPVSENSLNEHEEIQCIVIGTELIFVDKERYTQSILISIRNNWYKIQSNFNIFSMLDLQIIVKYKLSNNYYNHNNNNNGYIFLNKNELKDVVKNIDINFKLNINFQLIGILDSMYYLNLLKEFNKNNNISILDSFISTKGIIQIIFDEQTQNKYINIHNMQKIHIFKLNYINFKSDYYIIDSCDIWDPDIDFSDSQGNDSENDTIILNELITDYRLAGL